LQGKCLLNILRLLRPDKLGLATTTRFGCLEVLHINGAGEFFERAARAFGFGSAKFFAESYKERMVLIEKLRILRQI
jgi:hypothetical protein